MVLRHPGRRGGSRGRSAPPSGALWVAPGVGGLVVGRFGGRQVSVGCDDNWCSSAPTC